MIAEWQDSNGDRQQPFEPQPMIIKRAKVCDIAIHPWWQQTTLRQYGLKLQIDICIGIHLKALMYYIAHKGCTNFGSVREEFSHSKHYPLQRHLPHGIFACRIKHPHILLTCRSTLNLIPRKQGLELHLVLQNVKQWGLEGYYWIAPNALGKVVGMQRSRTCKKSYLGADW